MNQKHGMNLRLQISCQVKAAFFGALIFGLFCHGTGLFNKLSHQDDIANLFTYGATITSGRWMLHVLSWLEGLLFGTGNTSLPLYNGLISLLCVAAVSGLLVDLLKIRNPVYSVLTGCLMSAFPVITALFSYMFTSHPYMIGLLMMGLCGYLICREVPWWMKIIGVLLGGASIGIYQAWLPMLLAMILIDDIMKITEKTGTRVFLRRAGIQIICVVGVMAVYFAANRFFLHKFGLELSSYQGIDQMGRMSVSTFLERVGKAYSLFFRPLRNVPEDMYPGTLYGVYYLTLAVAGALAVRRVIRTGRENLSGAGLLVFLFVLIPVGCNFIYIMSEEAHGLMVYGQVMLFVLMIALLDNLESSRFRGRQTVSLIASLALALTGLMYARFDNQCYLKETLQQSEAMSYYTTLITRIKSQEGYTPNTEICFVNNWSGQDPTIYNPEELDFIHLNLYGRDTTKFIHYYKEFFMEKWCGFSPNWYWGEDPSEWQEVQEMPEYPADGSIRVLRDVLIVKF